MDDVTPPEVITFIMSLMEATESKMALIVGRYYSIWHKVDYLLSDDTSGVFTGLSVVAAALATNKDGKILAVENPEYLKYWNQIGNNFVKNVRKKTAVVTNQLKVIDENIFPEPTFW